MSGNCLLMDTRRERMFRGAVLVSSSEGGGAETLSGFASLRRKRPGDVV